MKLYTVVGFDTDSAKDTVFHYTLAIHDYEAKQSFKKEYPGYGIFRVVESEKEYIPDGTEFISESLACPLPYSPDRYVM